MGHTTCGHPSRLAEDGGYLRMTKVLLHDKTAQG
jgi:hypothetical protein